METSKREAVLATAIKIITGDRDKTYGTPESNMADIAKYWSLYLEKEIAAHDVCSMMELLKIARRKAKPEYEDNYTDAAGYAALGYEVAAALEVLDSKDPTPYIPLKKKWNL